MMGEASAGLAAARAGWDAYVPAGHLLRRVDAVLDLSGVRERLRPRYSRIGRPSVDPTVLLRMLLVGYLYGITSERRLADEVRDNIAYRWVVGLADGAPVPYHSTFSKARHGRFRDTGVFRALFEGVLRRCLAAGLVAGGACSVDGSFIEADAGAERRYVDASRAEAHVGSGGRLLSALRSPAAPDARPRPVRVLHELPAGRPARGHRRRRGHARSVQRRVGRRAHHARAHADDVRARRRSVRR